MLRALEIQNFVIVEKTSLEFSAGFSVLTGETGAGKSILVDAIELLVGGRADAAVVREGAERAELSGEFEVSKAMSTWLAERDLAGDPGQLILRRSGDVVRFVHPPGYRYFATLREKLGWSEAPAKQE